MCDGPACHYFTCKSIKSCGTNGNSDVDYAYVANDGGGLSIKHKKSFLSQHYLDPRITNIKRYFQISPGTPNIALAVSGNHAYVADTSQVSLFNK